jgi:hypothetical protein
MAYRLFGKSFLFLNLLAGTSLLLYFIFRTVGRRATSFGAPKNVPN